MMGLSVYDVSETIAAVTLEEAERALREGIDPRARALSIVVPAAR